MYATFSRSANYTDHRYWYAHWDGEQWRKRQLTRAGTSIDPDGEIMYSAGITLDHDNPDIVYLARKKGDWFQIEVWRTRDRGATWSVTPITSSPKNHMRPVAPRNHPSTQVVQVLFMLGRYDSYTTYRTTVALTNRTLA